jgi:hypothetical protein
VRQAQKRVVFIAVAVIVAIALLPLIAYLISLAVL